MGREIINVGEVHRPKGVKRDGNVDESRRVFFMGAGVGLRVESK